MTLPKLPSSTSTLQRALAAFSVNKPSSHPTPTDSARVESSLFGDDTAPCPSPDYNNTNTPSLPPLVSNVVVKTSSALNSERATGMNKVQQVQFVDMLKRMIVDEAPILHTTYTAFKIMTSRNHTPSRKNIFDASVHVAHLIAVNADGEVVLLERSRACEFLPDAVEDLWEKVMEKNGVVVAGVEVGGRLGRQRVGSSATMVEDGEIVLGGY